MANRFKKYILAGISALMILSVTACGQKGTYTMDAEAQAQLEDNAAGIFFGIMAMDDDTLADTIEQFEYEQNTVIVNGINGWISSRDDLGEFVDIIEVTSSRDEKSGEYNVLMEAQFEKRNCEFTFGLDRMQKEMTELTFNAEYTLGEKLGSAAGNLVIGMGTVFAVLVFLTWVISMFKHIPALLSAVENIGKKAPKQAEEAPKPAAPAPQPKAEPVPVQVPAGDEEMAAVIAAAIAAYESEMGSAEAKIVKQPALANGIVVRSYKRR